MLKKILLILLPVLAFIGGSAAGAMLTDATGAAPNDAAGHAADAPAGSEASASGEAADGGGDHETAAAPADDHGTDGHSIDGEAGWFRFPNQFFVPVIRNGKTDFVMILTVTLETPAEATPEVEAMEHRLRDSLLRQLMIHANTGGFDGNYTAEAHLSVLREAMLNAAQDVAGANVRAVLIEDIARKDG